MKNVLITGSSGFIGYHLSLLYLKKGFRVFGIDNHSDGYDVKLKKWRYIELKKNKNFLFNKIDISSEKKLILYFEKFFKKNSEYFEILAEEHIKKINELKLENKHK